MCFKYSSIIYYHSHRNVSPKITVIKSNKIQKITSGLEQISGAYNRIIL